MQPQLLGYAWRQAHCAMQWQHTPRLDFGSCGCIAIFINIMRLELNLIARLLMMTGTAFSRGFIL